MKYKRRTFKPVLEVVDEIDFDENMDELLLEHDKIYQKQIDNANNKLTLYERAILFELHYWIGIL